MRRKQGMALMEQGAQRQRHRSGPGTFAEGKQQEVPAEPPRAACQRASPRAPAHLPKADSGKAQGSKARSAKGTAVDPTHLPKANSRRSQRSSHAQRARELHHDPYTFAEGKQWVSSGEAPARIAQSAVERVCKTKANPSTTVTIAGSNQTPVRESILRVSRGAAASLGSSLSGRI